MNHRATRIPRVPQNNQGREKYKIVVMMTYQVVSVYIQRSALLRMRLMKDMIRYFINDVILGHEDDYRERILLLLSNFMIYFVLIGYQVMSRIFFFNVSAFRGNIPVQGAVSSRGRGVARSGDLNRWIIIIWELLGESVNKKIY
uniref:SecA_6 protein n=1 Tax=Fopius arisanus TaxID=64838 RepID=A0A0C9QKE3_9HYME